MCDALRRTQLAEARRSVRVALTAVQQALSGWATATSSGRAALLALSNDALSHRYLPHHALGPLQAIPGLVEAGQRKLAARVQAHVRVLAGCVDALRGCSASLTAAQDVGSQQGAALTVFRCLSCTGIATLLGSVAAMHAQQLEVGAEVRGG